MANGATKKEIGRAKEFIVKQLEIEKGQSMEMGAIHAGDFLVSQSFPSFFLKKTVYLLFIYVYILCSINIATTISIYNHLV